MKPKPSSKTTGIVFADLETLSSDSSEDIALSEYIPEFPGEVSNLLCGECGSPMPLKSFVRDGRKMVFYGCSTFPVCRGSLGAYPDGRPMGTPGDKATRKARINAHRYFDSLWKVPAGQKKAKMTRSQAYTWLRKEMKITDSEAHFAKFSLAQCEEAVRLIKLAHPETRDFWDRLSDGLDI